MTNLVEYVEKELKKGFSKEEVKETLLKAGWSEEDINKGFKEVDDVEFVQHKHHLPKYWFMVLGIFLVVLITFGLVFKYSYYDTQMLEDCKSLNNFRQKYNCLLDLGKINKPILPTSDCDKIKDINEKDICLIKLAKETNNIGFCHLIHDKNKNLGCQTSPWKENDCKFKKLLGEEYKDCFYEEALIKKNTKWCSYTKELKKRCIIKIIDITNIAEDCMGEKWCLIYLAEKNKDINYCKAINEYSSRVECYNKLGQDCKDINDKSFKEYCQNNQKILKQQMVIN